MYSTGWVSDLCTAIGEFIDDDPKGAALAAKKLGAVLLAQHERIEQEEEDRREQQKLSAGREHELAQRRFDVLELEAQVQDKRAQGELVEAEAVAAKSGR